MIPDVTEFAMFNRGGAWSMGAQRFDRLARVVSSPGSRRGLLWRLAYLSLATLLATLLDSEEAAAKRRRNRKLTAEARVGGENHKHKGRRRKHNLPRKHRHKKKYRNKRCRRLDDGSCACSSDSCGAGFVCDTESGSCVACGEVAQICCGNSSCGTGQICNAEQTCVACGGDDQPCCAGGQCDGALVCDPENGLCSPADFDYILSGGPNATTPLNVDDDLRVELNDQIVFNDTNGLAGDVAPISFRAQPGDTLRVVATNVVPPCVRLSPLTLHRTDNGQTQVLDADGFAHSCAGHTPGIFYNQTFTIAL
jgi:hypothetical protein